QGTGVGTERVKPDRRQVRVTFDDFHEGIACAETGRSYQFICHLLHELHRLLLSPGCTNMKTCQKKARSDNNGRPCRQEANAGTRAGKGHEHLHGAKRTSWPSLYGLKRPQNGTLITI